MTLLGEITNRSQGYFPHKPILQKTLPPCNPSNASAVAQSTFNHVATNPPIVLVQAQIPPHSFHSTSATTTVSSFSVLPSAAIIAASIRATPTETCELPTMLSFLLLSSETSARFLEKFDRACLKHPPTATMQQYKDNAAFHLCRDLKELKPLLKAGLRALKKQLKHKLSTTTKTYCRELFFCIETTNWALNEKIANTQKELAFKHNPLSGNEDFLAHRRSEQFFNFLVRQQVFDFFAETMFLIDKTSVLITQEHPTNYVYLETCLQDFKRQLITTKNEAIKLENSFLKDA